MSLSVAVIGAGVAGLTTAWELLNDGHRVELFDTNSGIAEGASFASSGCVAPAALAAWDWGGHGLAPGGGGMLPPPWARNLAGMAWLRQRKRQLATEHLNAVFDGVHALGQLTEERITASMKQLHHEVESAQGVLLLLNSDEVRKGIRPGLDHLKRAEVRLFEMDAGSARTAEPALNADVPLAGAIALPTDFVLNGRQWLALLKTEIVRMGGLVHLRSQVSQLTSEGRFQATTTGSQQAQAHQFDAVVVCAGHDAARLLKPLGMAWPLMVLNHCSVSAPVRDPLNAPNGAVIDAQQRVTITRMGQRMRASAGEPLIPGSNAQAVFRRLYQVMETWFPGASQLHGAHALVQTWQASCAHTPDGLPLVGRTSHPRIWLNTAHGSRGWTLGPGSSRLLADLITRRPTSGPVERCSPQRFGRTT